MCYFISRFAMLMVIMVSLKKTNAIVRKGG